MKKKGPPIDIVRDFSLKREREQGGEGREKIEEEGEEEEGEKVREEEGKEG